MTKYLRNFILSVMCAFAVCGVVMTWANQEQSSIAQNILRFHVVANSDEQFDQELKLKVRDAVISFVQGETKDVQNLDETRSIVEQSLDEIEQIASAVIASEGYTYPVTANVGRFEFPTKNYGDIALPPGEYSALRISIGEAKGQNWWCVIYPNICIVGNSATLPIESKQQLHETLSEDEYDLVSGQEPVKFRILELFNR